LPATSFKYLRKSFLTDGCFKAKSTVAFKKPNLFPQSYLTPSNRKP